MSASYQMLLLTPEQQNNLLFLRIQRNAVAGRLAKCLDHIPDGACLIDSIIDCSPRAKPSLETIINELDRLMIYKGDEAAQYLFDLSRRIGQLEWEAAPHQTMHQKPFLLYD